MYRFDHVECMCMSNMLYEHAAQATCNCLPHIMLSDECPWKSVYINVMPALINLNFKFIQEQS